MNSPHDLSIHELLEAQAEIVGLLKANEAAFLAIREANQPLAEKWQKFLHVLLPIQLKVIAKYGLSPNQDGLSHFNKQYSQGSALHSSLFDLNKRKWLFLFDKAFGVTEYKEMSLQGAQDLIADITKEMTSERFLKQIDDVLSHQEGLETLTQKRMALLTLLLPLHMEVMSRHGFDGEQGYLLAQRALMDHYHDADIAHNTACAQAVVFKRAQCI